MTTGADKQSAKIIASVRRDGRHRALDLIQSTRKHLFNLERAVRSGVFPIWLDEASSCVRTLELLAARDAVLAELQVELERGQR